MYNTNETDAVMSEQTAGSIVSFRWRMFAWAVYTSSYMLFAIAVGVSISLSDDLDASRLAVANLLAEANAESAVDNASLEFARRQYVRMLRDTVANLEAQPSGSTQAQKISRELEKLAVELESRVGSSADPRNAIESAGDALAELYADTQKLPPAWLSFANIEESPASTIARRRLEDDLDRFEVSVVALAKHFPLNRTLVSDNNGVGDKEEYQGQLVSAVEAVCQDSRVTYFLLSLDVGTGTLDQQTSQFLDRFFKLERKALQLCREIVDTLPEGLPRGYVSKITQSIERRLQAMKAYEARDFVRVLEIQRHPGRSRSERHP